MRKTNTKEKITSSFEILLKTNEFDSITLNDIINTAGVSKASFYRHFKDKYELLEYKWKDELYNLVSYNSFPSSISSNYIIFVTYLFENKNFFMKVLKTEGQNSFEATFPLACKKVFEGMYYKKHKTVPDEIISITELYCMGLAAYYRQWALRNFKESPEYIAKTAYEAIPEILKTYF